MNDTVTVLPRHNHRGLQLDDVAMDTIGQYNNLMIQQHPEAEDKFIVCLNIIVFLVALTLLLVYLPALCLVHETHSP